MDQPNQFTVVGFCQMDCTQGEENFKLDQTKVMLQFSTNVDSSTYFNPDGTPNKDGIVLLTTNFIQGLAANITYAAENNLATRDEHYEFILSQFEAIRKGKQLIYLKTSEDGTNN